MKRATELSVVQTTVDSEEAARTLSRRIVEERLAACVQVTPIESVYRWQGAMETAAEWRLTAKTRTSLTDRLADRIKELHTYDLPEIVVTPITGGSEEYLEWVKAETMSR
jgi:periplasmic divalent cation tolerance protein